MSRYLILVLLNLPLIFAALLSALVDYKMGKLSGKSFVRQIVIWVVIFAGLACTKFIYEFLFTNKLTQTEPLSLFDVIQITGIIIVLFMANRTRLKLDILERRVQDLHQELSIRLSKDKQTKSR
jgi:hypothetical protein